jgi:hypothetical protein
MSSPILSAEGHERVHSLLRDEGIIENGDMCFRTVGDGVAVREAGPCLRK